MADVEKSKWFGVVRWCDDDIEVALEQRGFEPTRSNVSEIRQRCENHHFTDAMIEAGWETIYCVIWDADNDGKLK